MRFTQRGYRLAFGPISALLACGVGIFGAASAPAAAAGPNTSCQAPNIAVLVQFPNGGGDKIACVASTSSPTGWAVLLAGGFSVQQVTRYSDLFVCRIDDVPNITCADTPPAAAAWTYWHADPGDTSWTHSNVGAGHTHPRPGSVDAWTLADKLPTFSPAAVLPAAAPPPAQPAPARPAEPAPAPLPADRATSAPATGSGSPAPAQPETASPTSSIDSAATHPSTVPPVDNPDPTPAVRAVGHHTSSTGGSPVPTLVCGTLIALLAAGTVAATRRRRQPSRPPVAR